MPARTANDPKYRLYRPKNLAVVRIDGHDHYLGPYGSPESWERYYRLLAERRTAGLVRPPESSSLPTTPPLSVNELILAYWRHAEEYYRSRGGAPSREPDNLRDALRPLRQLYGLTPAAEFGALALRAVRDELVRSGLARTTVNARVHRIRRVFRWAVSHELVPESVVDRLWSVESLRAGRSEAREPDEVEPVPIEHVEEVLPLLPRPVAAMVRLQLLTGCRVGEVVAVRGCDLTVGDPTWEYRPTDHKNAWRGQDRVIPLGPKAQAVLRGFLTDDPSAYLFAPREAVGEHHARRSAARRTKRTPSELARRCAGAPGAGRAERYDRRTYRQAVVRACRRAGVPPWSPLRLRHTAATLIRARYGLEAAQSLLGHSRPDTTLIYAERDLARARAIAAESG
jgi:integrase